MIEGEYRATTRDRAAEREQLFEAVTAKGWFPVGLLIVWRLWLNARVALDGVTWWLRRRRPLGVMPAQGRRLSSGEGSLPVRGYGAPDRR